MLAIPNDWFYVWAQINLGKVVGAGRDHSGYGTKISATTGWPDLSKFPNGDLGFFEVKDGTRKEWASPSRIEVMRLDLFRLLIQSKIGS